MRARIGIWPGLVLVVVPIFTLTFAAGHAQDLCFQVAANYSAGNVPQSVFAADLDGDGDPDLVVANANSDNVSVLKNDGDGIFQVPVNYPVAHVPVSVFAADLDGDNDNDLAVANAFSHDVSVLMNSGDGTFQTPVNYPAGYSPYSVFAGDMDGDNDNDLAVVDNAGSAVSVMKNNGDGTFQAPVNYAVGLGPYALFVADLDGDNDLDLAVANEASNNVSVLKNDGNGTFQGRVNYTAADGPFTVFAVDLDGDNDLDLAVANEYSDNVSVLKNNGDATFQIPVNYTAGDSPLSVVAADPDGDLDNDLVVTNVQSNNVSVLRNDGNGTFQTPMNYACGDGPASVLAADLDGDNDDDLVVANSHSNNIAILSNCLDSETGVILKTGVSSGSGTLALRVGAFGAFASRHPQGGLWRASDSSSGIYDGSLLIAHGPQAMGDTTVFLNFYSRSTRGQDGFQSVADPVIDTSQYDTDSGFACAKAKMITADSVVGITVNWYFPQTQSADEYMIARYRVYRHRPATSISNLTIGVLADVDVMPAARLGAIQVMAQNTPGMDFLARWLVWQRGSDTAGHVIVGTRTATRFRAGVAVVDPTSDLYMHVANGYDDLAPGNGPTDQFLYKELTTTYGAELFGDSAADLYTLVSLDRGRSIAVDETLTYTLVFASDTLDVASFKASIDAGRAAAPTLLCDCGSVCEPYVEITAYSPVNIVVCNPTYSDSIGPGFNTYGAVASYDSLTDYGLGPNGVPGELDDRVTIFRYEPGNYHVRVIPEPDADTSQHYFLGVRDPGGNCWDKYVAITGFGAGSQTFPSDSPVANPVPPLGSSSCFSLLVASQKRGDMNGDLVYDILDVTLVINVAFRGASPPAPPEIADLTGDGITDVLDIVRIIDTAFRGQSEPGP